MYPSVCPTSKYRLVCTGKRQQSLSDALEKAPPRTYLEAMGALLKWLGDMEAVLDTEKFVITDVEVLDTQLQQFRVGYLLYVKVTIILCSYELSPLSVSSSSAQSRLS